MSVNGPGQYGGYTPPPPSMNGMPRKARSPWVYVGLGCGGLAVLAFGGCIAAVVVVKNNVQHEMAQPVTESEVNHDLGDTPRYPGAKIDSQTTHIARLTMSTILKLAGADMGVGGAAGFTTSDPFLKVLAWYDEKLHAMGYKPGKQQSNGYTYQKGEDNILIQTSRSTADSGGTQFMVIRYKDSHSSGK